MPSAKSVALREAEEKAAAWKNKAVSLAKKAQTYQSQLEDLQARSPEPNRPDPPEPSSDSDTQYALAASQEARNAAAISQKQVAHLEQQLSDIEEQLQHTQTERGRAEQQLQDAKAKWEDSEREANQLKQDLEQAAQETSAAMEKEARLRGMVFGALTSGGGGPALLTDDTHRPGDVAWKTIAYSLAAVLLLGSMLMLMDTSASAAVEERWEYYANDLPQSRTSMREEGERHGMWQTFHENGVVASSGYYESGFKEGSWKTWNANDELETELWYERSIAVRGTQWWPNGQKRRSGPLQDGERHGEWSIWRDNGQLSGQGPVFEGARLGVWRLYDADGEWLPSVSGTYDGDSLATIDGLAARHYEGEFIRWHDNGAVAAEGKFTGGIPVGKFTEYHPNETVAKVMEFRDGLLEDTVRGWGEQGELLAEQMFEGGKRHGSSIEKYPSGQMRSEGHYSNDSPSGVWITWHANGNKESEGTYLDGNKQELWSHWFEDGHPRTEQMFEGGRQHGRSIEKYPSGQMRSEGHYSNNSPSGVWITWHANGQKSAEGTYKEGKKEGVWTDWHDNGNKESEGAYLSLGSRQGPWEFFGADGSADSERTGYYHEDERLPNPVGRTAWDEDGNFRYKEKSRNGHVFFVSRRWPQADGDPVLSTFWAGKLATELEQLANVKFTGDVHINWEATGKRRAIGQMRLGRNEGSWDFYHPNDELQTSGTFSDGHPEGSWRLMPPTGTKLAEVNFRGGQLDGATKAWDAEGALVVSGAYSMSRRTGPWRFWYEKDSLRAEGAFLDGEQSGPWKFWSQGQTDYPVLEGQFAEGLRTGTWNYRSSNNKHVAVAGNYKLGERAGDFREFAGDGTTVLRVQFSGGKRHGTCEFFTDSESPIVSGSYSQGDPNGIWTSWWVADPLEQGRSLPGKKRYQGDFLATELPMMLLEQIDSRLAPLDNTPSLPEFPPIWPWQ